MELQIMDRATKILLTIALAVLATAGGATLLVPKGNDVCVALTGRDACDWQAIPACQNPSGDTPNQAYPCAWIPELDGGTGPTVVVMDHPCPRRLQGAVCLAVKPADQR